MHPQQSNIAAHVHWLIMVAFFCSFFFCPRALNGQQHQQCTDTGVDENNACNAVSASASNPLVSSSTILLNDGVSIPVMGLGTYTPWRIQYWRQTLHGLDTISDDLRKENELNVLQFRNAIITALKYGYRHIDSAVAYATEQVIGDTLVNDIYPDPDLNIEREDLFITSKIPMSADHELHIVKQEVEQTLQFLQTDYIDLYLLHSPHSKYDDGNDDGDIPCETDADADADAAEECPVKHKRGSDVLEVYQLLLDYQTQGKIKSVGVSNFNIHHLQAIERHGLPLPSVNQIEVHCFLYETALIEYCLQQNIVIQAYCPIARANEIAVKHPLLNELGIKYHKEWAQIMIRWLIQKGFVVLPKSVRDHRIISNANVFDFVIEEDDMRVLDELKHENLRVSWNPLLVEWDV